MPKIVRLYIINVAIGFAIAAVFVGMILWFNIANLWHLVSTSEMGLLAVLILWIFNGIVFAGVQFAIAVMRLQDDDDDDEPRGGRRHRAAHPQPSPVPVRAPAGRALGFWQKN